MNFGQFLVHLGHVLGLLRGDDPTLTTLSTIDDLRITNLTTPVILDNTTLETFIGNGTTVSQKFLSTLSNSSKHDVDETSLVTGVTAETETTFIEPNATVTGNDTTGTEPDTTVTGNGTVTEPDTTVTGNDTSVTEPDTPVTGNGTVTEPDTTVPGNGTTVTSHTTVTKSPTTVTDAAPTEKPGLSRGAVAGIVIGCLLLVAVIAAAIVFFLKNRNTPAEAQRLRV